VTRIPLSRSKGHVSTCRGRGIVAGTQQTSIVVLLTLSTWTTDWQSAFCTALVRHVVSLRWLDADAHCICSLYLTSTVRRIHRWSSIFRSCIFSAPSQSSRAYVWRFADEMDTSRPAFQGHSRSSELTRIDPVPTTFC